MKNRLVLCFDLDGVIVDNTAAGMNRINQALVELGLPPVSTEFLRKNWGKKVSDFHACICEHLGVDAGKLIEFSQHISKISMKAPLDMDLIGSLISLPQFGFCTAIITSRDRPEFIAYAQEIGLDLGMFDYIQTIDDYPYCKPDGDVFKPLLQWAKHEVGSKAGGSIAYFGDTIQYDYQAVLNAKAQGHDIKFTGVCSGVNDYEEFRAAGLDTSDIIPSHDVLSFYLNRLVQEKNRSIAQALHKKFAGNVDLGKYAFL